MKPIGWITPESVSRLQRGGNSKGTVPMHEKQSSVASIPVYADLSKRKRKKKVAK